MKKYNTIKAVLALSILMYCATNVCLAQSITATGTINASLENTASRVAPGDFLTTSIKLLNFGSQNRVDVIVYYKIINDRNTVIYAESETVAVDTTASFVKRLQLPDNVEPGSYTAQVSLTYPYQEKPAVSEFQFKVEEKIFGIFRTDFIFYSVIFLAVILAVIIFTYLAINRRTKQTIVMYDYSSKPKNEIIYYEILSDIISQMRLRAGDDALEIAKNIPDLEINGTNGMIINIKKDPAKIIALLISRYEELLGQKVSFSLRQKK